MPGVYYYQYTLTNADGHSAVPVNLTVQIYEQVLKWLAAMYVSTCLLSLLPMV